MILDVFCPHLKSKISSYATKCPSCTHDTRDRVYVPISSVVNRFDTVRARSLLIGLGVGVVFLYFGWDTCWSGFVMIVVAVVMFSFSDV